MPTREEWYAAHASFRPVAVSQLSRTRLKFDLSHFAADQTTFGRQASRFSQMLRDKAKIIVELDGIIIESESLPQIIGTAYISLQEAFESKIRFDVTKLHGPEASILIAMGL